MLVDVTYSLIAQLDASLNRMASIGPLAEGRFGSSRAVCGHPGRSGVRPRAALWPTSWKCQEQPSSRCGPKASRRLFADPAFAGCERGVAQPSSRRTLRQSEAERDYRGSRPFAQAADRRGTCRVVSDTARRQGDHDIGARVERHRHEAQRHELLGRVALRVADLRRARQPCSSGRGRSDDGRAAFTHQPPFFARWEAISPRPIAAYPCRRCKYSRASAACHRSICIPRGEFRAYCIRRSPSSSLAAPGPEPES
jgi:hypothetical protein